MLVSLHQGLFSYCGKIRDSCSVFRGVRLLQTVSFITAGGSAAFSISAALGVIRTAATWVIVWVFHITLIVGSNVFHHSCHNRNHFMLQIKPLMILSARQSWFYLRIMPQS